MVVTSANAKKLESIKSKATWPIKARVTKEIVYLDASEEERAVIAGAGSENEIDEKGHFVLDRVSARNRLVAGEVDSHEVTHMDAALKQIVGTSAALIPFIEKNYVYRSLMGSNQQRQAVPLINPMAPVVGTGVEATAARNTGQIILAEANGKIVKATADDVIVDYGSVVKSYHPQHFQRSNEGSSINQKVVVNSGDNIKTLVPQ